MVASYIKILKSFSNLTNVFRETCESPKVSNGLGVQELDSHNPGVPCSNPLSGPGSTEPLMLPRLIK